MALPTDKDGGFAILPAADLGALEHKVLSSLVYGYIGKGELLALLRAARQTVFDIAKEGGVGVTFSIGDKVYWDDGNDFAVATDGAGANKLLGKAVLAAADADTTVRVRLSQ